MNIQLTESAFKEIFQKSDARLLESIEDNLNVPKDIAISIYKNNALGAQLSSLQSTYSVCERLVGEACFQQITLTYLQAQPMNTRDLNRFAKTFPDFIEKLQKQETTLNQVSYLSDMARLELYLNHAYYANKQITFDTQQFSNLTNEEQSQVTFLFNDDLNLLSSQFPLQEIWEAHQKEPIEPISVKKDRYSYVIHRPKNKVEISPIPYKNYGFLQAIQNNLKLGELCHQFPEQINLLGAYIQNGWLGSFRTQK